MQMVKKRRFSAPTDASGRSSVSWQIEHSVPLGSYAVVYSTYKTGYVSQSKFDTSFTVVGHGVKNNLSTLSRLIIIRCGRFLGTHRTSVKHRTKLYLRWYYLLLEITLFCIAKIQTQFWSSSSGNIESTLLGANSILWRCLFCFPLFGNALY